jgi:hypothetical protein
VDARDAASPQAEWLASQAATDPAALSGLLAAVGPDSKPHPVREASAEALKLLAIRDPGRVLVHWDDIIALLDCSNAFSRTIAVHVIASLAPADDPGRLAAILDRLFDHLGDAVSVAGHVLQVSPQIARTRPELEGRITARLLDLPRLARPDRLGLLRSYAIEALDAYLKPAGRTPEVVSFVEAGLAEGSPKARKLAAEVLRRWGAA